MSAIKILPENLINQIAAGEVVERHSSVVKELIENSIDAKADKITVEIEDKNKDIIKITDNGTGMSFDDAILAFERHATSKISNASDLENINTMGFRGEAIASIASVSHVVLKTKKEHDKTGTIIECEYGKIVKHEECACPSGTSIKVRNLFFNTPARKKHLKSPKSEYQLILYDFQAIALANPGIDFSLFHNKKKSFQYIKTDKLLERIKSVFGSNTHKNCIEFEKKGNSFSVIGYIGKPVLSQSGTKHQYLFINGRPVKNHLFSYAIAKGYESMLMSGRKPFYVFNMTIKPEYIDVNVHPRKLEVRLTNQNEIFGALQKTTKDLLTKNSLMPSFDYSYTKNEPKTVAEQNSRFNFDAHTQKRGNLNKYSYKQESKKEASMIPIAQIAKSYIIAEHEEGIVLIDQHAAHERILFEKLMDSFEKNTPSKQQLLMPQNIDLSPFECEILKSNIEVFKKLGFEIEPFGGNTFIIQSVPSFLSKENIDSIITSVINDIETNKNTDSAKKPQIKIIEYTACRSAIKFGKDLSIDEMHSLISQLDDLKRPYTCPHGRPSMVKLTYNELEKRFKRT